jgi:hypothetical protein
MPRIPKEADIKQYLIDADIIEERKEKQKSGLVFNPLSFLRFDPKMGTSIRIREKLDSEFAEEIEPEGTVDFAKEVERAGVDGLTRAIKGILEIPAAIIDGAANTNLTSKLDTVTRKFLQEHGNPKTFAGDLGSVLTQYGAPSTIAFKIIGNVGKLKKIRKLDDYLKNKFGKVYTKTAGSDLARRVGQGGLSLGAADFLVSDADRPTLFVDKVSEEGKTGRDLAVARLANKVKFAQDGTLLGGGIPLAGKGLSLGARYGLLKPGAKILGIGAKVADAVVVNPLSKLLARTPFLPELTSAVRSLPGKAREAAGLPPFEQWRMFSVDNSDPLRRTLKRVDNFLSYLRSIGKQSPEQANVAFRGEKRIIAQARTMEKLLDSVEKRAYDLAKANQKYYDSLTTSPASRDKYLDEVLEFLKGERPITQVQEPLQATAKQLANVLDETKKLYRDLLPDDKAAGSLKEILTNNLKGYMRKSFAVFTNPSYSVSRNSEVFKNAVDFVKKIKDPDQKKRVIAKMRDNPNMTAAQAANEIAAENVESILRYAKTDNKDPIQILTSIAKRKLDMDKFIATGDELPDVIRKLLGEEKNLRNTVLQTVSTLSTSSTNKLMFDRLAEILVKQKQLFKTRQQAERGLNIAREGGKIRRIPISAEVPGVGLLKTKLSGLYGPADRVNQILTLKGPLDELATIPGYKNFLQFKVAAQYGKTVLSPATQTRNFSSASFFVLNRGLLGGRSSVTESIKMTVDDIFNAGKGGADSEKKLLESIAEGIKYGALDENIVASELNAVLRAIRKGAIKDTDQLTGFLEKKGLLRTASRIYAGGDNVWKWYAYNWYKSFLKDYAKNDLGRMKTWFRDVAGMRFDPKDLLGKKKGVEEAIKEAAGWYVRNTMPTYSLVPRLIQAVRATPLGNFVSFPAEMIRTTANTLRTNMREISSDDVILREMGYRGAMGQFVTLGGASIAAKKIYGALTGVTEDVMNAYKDYVAPDFQRNSDLIAVTKPENGVFKVVDLSTFMPYNAVTRPIEAMFNAIRRQKQTPQSIDRFLLNTFFGSEGPIAELIAPFVNQTIAAETISEVLNNKKKEGGQIYSELDDFPEVFEKSFKHIIKSVEPGAVTTGRQAYYGFREQLTPTGQSYDLEDVLLGLGSGVKPLRIDLKRSSDFIIGDLNKIRTEAPKTSPLYRKNMSRRDILEEYVNIQRNAFNEQARIHKAFEAMKDLSLPEKEIRKEIIKRKSNKKLGFKVLKGKFEPINYSVPRFKDKIKEVEKDITRRGRTPQLNKNDMFPRQKLNEIKRFLMNQDLNQIFPFDITTDPEPRASAPEPTVQQTSSIQTPPLPKTPTPVQSVRNVAPINPNTGLTTTETALLSPEEQAIRLRQRT